MWHNMWKTIATVIKIKCIFYVRACVRRSTWSNIINMCMCMQFIHTLYGIHNFTTPDLYRNNYGRRWTFGQYSYIDRCLWSLPKNPASSVKYFLYSAYIEYFFRCIHRWVVYEIYICKGYMNSNMQMTSAWHWLCS